MSGLTIPLADAEATTRLGAALAPLMGQGEALLLYGPLGMGKSTLARGLIRAITTPDEDVPSPTFTLVQLYDSDPPVAHFDLYRLTRPEEAVEIGLDVADAALRTRATQSAPRLRAAYNTVVQRVASTTLPGMAPDVERLVAQLQAVTNATLGRAGARLLIGTVLVV